MPKPKLVAVRNVTSSALSVEIAPLMSVTVEPGESRDFAERLASSLIEQEGVWALADAPKPEEG